MCSSGSKANNAVNYGAFLRSIPVHRRVGDYAHAAARILYGVYKRLCTSCGPRCGGEMRDYLASVAPAAKHLTAAERAGAPASSSKTGINITDAHLFLSSEAHVANFVAIVQQYQHDVKVPFGDGRQLLCHIVVKYLLISLATVYKKWRQKCTFSPSDQSAYLKEVNSFRACWVALNWKPTVWVHWMCAHSVDVLASNCNLYAFSSLPTERRHQAFKLDLRHAFQGWKIASPRMTPKYLKCVIEQDALHLALSVAPGRKRARA